VAVRLIGAVAWIREYAAGMRFLVIGRHRADNEMPGE
jgi:hypothetical protein